MGCGLGLASQDSLSLGIGLLLWHQLHLQCRHSGVAFAEAPVCHGHSKARAWDPRGRRLGPNLWGPAGQGGAKGGFFQYTCCFCGSAGSPRELAGREWETKAHQDHCWPGHWGRPRRELWATTQGCQAVACPTAYTSSPVSPQCETFLSTNLHCPACTASARWVGCSHPSPAAPALRPRHPAAGPP